MLLKVLWGWIWSWAGAVPVRWKVIGIVVASQLVAGLSIAWWVRTSLGQWLSYLLSEDKVVLAMDAGMRGVLVVTALAAVGGVVLAWILTIILTEPILDLASRARRVASGDLSVRSPVWANDEMGYLASSFNTMVDVIESSRAELVKSHQELSRSNEELLRVCEDLKGKEEMRVSLLSRVVSAQEEERQRLSRELHDGAGQMLASLLVHLKLIEKATDASQIKERTEELRGLVVTTLEETRRLAVDLRPSGLDDLGLAGAIDWLARSVEKSSGMDVSLDLQGLERRLPKPVEAQLYRIVQEMLTNVSKHSRASRVAITMTMVGETLRILVEDDGIGFDASTATSRPDSGLGLLTMRERAGLLGGTFNLRSTPGHGTSVEITVPAVVEVAP
ncbi:MAG TPA: sensor histidine kinase [Chloroflexota bacterium]